MPFAKPADPDDWEISVVIPTADRPDLVKRAVDSVEAQSLVAREILVVDNGKTVLAPGDLTPTCRIIRTTPGIGPSAARNRGAEAAESPFVAFLDDDDIWEAEFLAHCTQVLRARQARVVVGRLDRRDQDGAQRRYKCFPEDPRRQRRVYFSNPGFGGQNIVLERALFLSLGGFDESLPASVDRDLCARLLQAGIRIEVASEAVAVLCDHAGDRVRGRQVTGNRLFIARHWRHMRPNELYRALSVLFRRYRRVRRNQAIT